MSDNENIIQESECSSDTEDEEEKYGIKAYTIRWMVMFIVCISTILRGFIQAYAGPVNNVYKRYLHVEAWQIDWLVITQSVALLVFVGPLSISVNRIGFKTTTLIMTSTQTIGFFISIIGVWYNTWGYGMLIFAQVFNGFSNCVSLSIPPAVSAIWFPKKEVPIAIGFAIAARGIGEALGTFVSPRVWLIKLL